MLAALTTSIPEAADSTRNWDYRYCWLRDSYFVVQTLNRLGATRTMEAYLHYIDHIIASSTADTLQPLYGITGDPRAEEKIATALSGYRGMGPVRFGNLAAEQVQHDVYGSVILAATQLFFDERLVRSRRPDAARTALPARASARSPPSRSRTPVPGNSAASCSGTRSPRRSPGPAATASARIARRVGDDDRGARVERARQLHARGNPRRRVERGAPGVHLGLRQPRPRRHRAAAAGARAAARHRSAFPQDAGAHRGRAARRRPAVPLQTCRRFRRARKRLHHLRVLVRERARRGRAASTRRASGSRACWRGAIRSACCPRTSRPRAASCGAIFRRPTAWSASSAARCACRAAGRKSYEPTGRGFEPHFGAQARRRARRTRGRIVGRDAGAARHVVRLGWRNRRNGRPTSRPSCARKASPSRPSISTRPSTSDFYLGFCNGTLWPLFHYFVDGFRYNDAQYEAYQRMNQRYARQLQPLLEPDDLIWVHDYHLFPLAQKLARGGRDAAHRPVPAHPVSQHRGAARAAGVRRAAAGHAGLRRARLPDRDRSRCVSLGGGVCLGPAGARRRQHGDRGRAARRHRRVSRSASTSTPSSARPPSRWSASPSSA